MARYRVIDTASSELDIVELDPDDVVEDASVTLPDGTVAQVLDIYDDEHGREGGVEATIVLDID